MDQVIIENMKCRYRKSLVESVLLSEDAIGIKEFLKNNNIKDAIFNVASEWANLNIPNIKNGWNKLWPEIT